MSSQFDDIYKRRGTYVAPKPAQGAASAGTPSRFEDIYARRRGQTAPADSPAGEQGFFDYTINVAKNYWQMGQVQDKMDMESLTGMPMDYTTDQQQIREAINKGAQVTGSDLAVKDFMAFGVKMFKDVGKQMNEVFSSPGQAIDQATSNPAGFVGGIAKAFVTPMGDFLEAQSGVKLSGEEIVPLTPEEKSERIKNVAATIAMMAVGGGVAEGLGASSKALQGAVALEKAALYSSEATTEGLAAASRLTRKGALGRELLKNSAVAMASGSAYGAVRYANEEDQLAQIIINGVIMAPLGVAFEAVSMGKGTRERMSVAKQAGEVATLRQAQSVFNNSLDGIVQNVTALATADDLAQAVMDGAVKTKGKRIIHIPGIKAEGLPILQAKTPKGWDSAVHLNPDGETGSVLVFPKHYSDTVEPLPVPGMTRLYRREKGGPRLSNAYELGPNPHVWTPDRAAAEQHAHGGDLHYVDLDAGELAFANSDRGYYGLPADSYAIAESLNNRSGPLTTKPAIDKKFFAENGFILDQMVSHNGKEYRVIGSDGGQQLKLEDVEAANTIKYGIKMLSSELTDNYGTRTGKYKFEVDGEKHIVQLSMNKQYGRWNLYVGLAVPEGYDFGDNTTRKKLGIRKQYEILRQAAKDFPEAQDVSFDRVYNFETGKPSRHKEMDIEKIKKNDWKWVNREEVRTLDNTKFANPEVKIPRRLNAAEQKIKEQLLSDKKWAVGTETEAETAARVDRNIAAMESQTVFRFGDMNRDMVLDGMYDNWKKQMEKMPPAPIDQAKLMRADLAAQMAKAPDHLQLELQGQSDRLEALIKKLEAPNGDVHGFNEPESGAIVDQAPPPGTDFNTAMRKYFDDKGFAVESHGYLADEFEKRLLREAHANELAGGDDDFIRELYDKFEEGKAATAETGRRAKQATSEDLVRRANTNGYSISDDGSGSMVIRDGVSGRAMLTTKSLEDAIKFVDQSGQAAGVDLDANGAFKGKNATGGRPLVGVDRPLDDPNPVYKFMQSVAKTAKNLSSEQAIRFLDNFALITNNREYFTNLDTKYGTKLFEKMFDPTQTARRTSNARIRPYYERLKQIEKIVKGLDAEQRKEIGEWMQTMTPAEVITKFKANRPLNPVEIKFGEMVGKTDVDLEQVFKYRRAVEDLKKEFPDIENDQQQKAEYTAKLDKAKEAFGINDMHQNVSDLFDEIEIAGKKEIDLGAVVRLARSMQNKEMSRGEYAAHKKMSLEALNAGQELEKVYAELSNTFGIPKAWRLGGYMTHARLYTDGNIIEALRMFGGDMKAREFYAKMSRTGELSAFETDPIRAMQRYIKSGMDAQHFNESYAAARKAVVEEIKTLPASMQEHVKNVTERYLGELRGFPGAGEAATEQVVEKLLKQFNISTDVHVRKQIVAAITAVVPAATQGIRLMAGIRDFATHMTMYSARFGFKRTANAIIQGAKAMTGPMREELERIGDITVASPIAFADATEAGTTALAGSRGKFARGFDATTRAMFRLSGQQDVYAMMHAGAYLETRQLTSASLLKMSRDEIKWKDVVKETKLKTYDQPVVDKFKSLVMDGKHEEASRFLAIQTGYEQIGVFGLANQPYMWGSNLGKIVGQFGRYPMWLRGNIQRMMSRGTVGQRAGSMARLAGATVATAMAGQAVGIDLSTWSPIKGMMFGGGPLVDAYQTVNDAYGGTGYFAEAAQGRLNKMLPWNRISQIYLPGSYFAEDLVNSIALFQQGQIGAGAAELAGFRPAQRKAGGL